MTEAAELGFDPATLKAKYRAERDKRLRQAQSEKLAPLDLVSVLVADELLQEGD